MSKFNLKDTFDQEVETYTELDQQTYQSANKVREKVFYYKDLIPNKKNRLVNHDKVLSIAESIIANGRMIDKPQVTLLDNGKALLWAGHHRTAAITYLVEEKGLKEFEYIKCDVLENNDLDNEILMIDTNLAREELSVYDKMNAIGRKEELYLFKKKNKELEYVGSARSYISSTSKNLNETQIGVHLRVYKKGCNEVKNALKDEKITLTQAYKLAALNEKEQKEKLKEILFPKKKKKQEDKALQYIRDKLEDKMNRKVSVNKNTITFKFDSINDLSNLLNELNLHDIVEELV